MIPNIGVEFLEGFYGDIAELFPGLVTDQRQNIPNGNFFGSPMVLP